MEATTSSLLRRSASSLASMSSLGSLSSRRNSISNSSLASKSGEAECRVCRCGKEAGPLFYPCKCKGSIRYVHESCLLEWMSVSQSKSCQVCNAEFEFALLYHNDTPTRLSNLELLTGTVLLGVKRLPTIIRYVGVGLIWLVLLPVSVQNIHEVFFATTFEQVKSAIFVYNIQMKNLLQKCLHGFCLEMVIACAFLAISTLQESVQRVRFLKEEDRKSENHFNFHTHFSQEPTEAHATVESSNPGSKDLPVIIEEDEEEIETELREAKAKADLDDASEEKRNDNNFFDINLIELEHEDEDLEIELDAAVIEHVEDNNVLIPNNNDAAALDVMLGLRGNFIIGVRNMVFITLANMVFLAVFQLIPFYVGRYVHPNFLKNVRFKERSQQLFLLLISLFLGNQDAPGDLICGNTQVFYQEQVCGIQETNPSIVERISPPVRSYFAADTTMLDHTYERIQQMKKEMHDAGTWYAMAIGYAVIIFFISLYVLFSNLMLLFQHRKHRHGDNGILTTYFIHIYMNLYRGLKFASISLIEFVLLEQAIGWVIHVGSLGIFGETLNDMPSHFDTCSEMPQLCFGVHWLLGTFTLTAANMFVSALKMVVCREYTDALSVHSMRRKFVKLFQRRRKYLSQIAEIGSGWKFRVMNKRFEKPDEDLKAPFPPRSNVDSTTFGDRSRRDYQGRKRYRNQSQTKSLAECIQDTMIVLLVSIPICFLLMVVPIAVIGFMFPSTFPLKLGGNLRSSEAVNTVIVSIDLFLMHTAVPYTLDTIKLGALIVWFIRMLVQYFAYHLDLHGCILRHNNPFKGIKNFIRVDPLQTKMNSIRESQGAKRSLNDDGFDISSNYLSECLGFIPGLGNKVIGSRVDIMSTVCSVTPWLDWGNQMHHTKDKNKTFMYYEMLNDTAVLALADRAGYAVPVFLAQDVILGMENEVVRAKQESEVTNDKIRESIESFCKYCVKTYEGDVGRLIQEFRGSTKSSFGIVTLHSFLDLLSRVDDGALYKSFCNDYLLPGFGRQCSADALLFLAQLHTLWKNHSSIPLVVIIKDALVSDKQGRSIVIDSQSKFVIEPGIDGAGELKESFNTRVLVGDGFKEGQFCLYRHEPPYVRARLFVLWILYSLSSIGLCMLVMSIPLLLGRKMFLMALLPLEHDLYHWSVGCATIWGLAYFTSWSIRNVYDQGFWDVVSICATWLSKKVKLFVCAVLMFIVVPTLCGLLFEKVAMFAYSYNATEVSMLSIQHNWAVGLALCKIISRLIAVGVFGDTVWIQKVEALQDIRGLDREWLVHEVVRPILFQLCLRLIPPYLFAKLIGGYLDPSSAEMLMRVSFPVFSGVLLVKDCLFLVTHLLDTFHDTVRDHRYIVGKKLKNYKNKLREAGTDVQRFLDMDLGFEEGTG